jgi:hypothetical protein
MITNTEIGETCKEVVKPSEYDLNLAFLCRLWPTQFTILSSYSFIGQNIFGPNWPLSDVQVVMPNDSAAHCDAFFSFYCNWLWLFWLCELRLVAFGFVWFAGCGCLEYSRWVGSSVVYWLAIIVVRGVILNRRYTLYTCIEPMCRWVLNFPVWQ